MIGYSEFNALCSLLGIILGIEPVSGPVNLPKLNGSVNAVIISTFFSYYKSHNVCCGNNLLKKVVVIIEIIQFLCNFTTFGGNFFVVTMTPTYTVPIANANFAPQSCSFLIFIFYIFYMSLHHL